MTDGSNPDTSNSTVVTRVTGKKDAGTQPLMSYTAVTSHRSMAEAFLREVLKFGSTIMHDRDLTVEDLMGICHIVLRQRESGVVMLEGRHLRGRIGEQLSRAHRYSESFSMIVLRLNDQSTESIYESMVDTLCERMRKTDLMFLFKSRIVLILPHTSSDACKILNDRISALLDSSSEDIQGTEIQSLTYPSETIKKSSAVLDWAEDQLRV